MLSTIEGNNREALFHIGCVVVTPGVLRFFESMGFLVMDFVNKHQCGDWGDLCKFDIQANYSAIKNHERVLSRYSIDAGLQKCDIYVITEWDRSITTVLLTEEY